MSSYVDRNFEEQKRDLEEQISNLKSYVATQELLPVEKRQIHLASIVGTLEGSKVALSNLEAYLRRPVEELEAEAFDELDAAIRNRVEVEDRLPNVSRHAVREAKIRVLDAEKKIEHIQLLK